MPVVLATQAFGLAALSLLDDLHLGHLDDDGTGAGHLRLTGETQTDHLGDVPEVHELLRTKGRERVGSSHHHEAAQSTRCDPTARRCDGIAVRLQHLEKAAPLRCIEGDVGRRDANFGVHDVQYTPTFVGSIA